MIMSWLLGSMTSEISDDFILYDTIADIWTAAAEMYSKRDNTAELYDLEAQLQEIKQEDQPVNKYYSELSKIWREIDMFEYLKWESPRDEQLFKMSVETKRLFKFLTCLHKDFDAIRSRILGSKPLLNLKVAFSEIRQEESRLKVMLGPSSISAPEGSAFLTKAKEENTQAFMHSNQMTGLISQPNIPQSRHPCKNLYCKYCHRTCHTIANCYRRKNSERFGQSSHQSRGPKPSGTESFLHSSPFERKQSPIAAPANCDNSGTTESLLQSQIEQILKILNQQGTPSQIQASMATSGNTQDGEDWQC